MKYTNPFFKKRKKNYFSEILQILKVKNKNKYKNILINDIKNLDQALNKDVTFFHSIKSGKTGMHYSTSLSREPIQTTDSLNVEFEIKSNELLEGSLIVEITNPDNERNIKYSQKIKIKAEIDVVINARLLHHFSL